MGICKVNKMCSRALSALALVVWGHTSPSVHQTLTSYPLPCPWYLEQQQQQALRKQPLIEPTHFLGTCSGPGRSMLGLGSKHPPGLTQRLPHASGQVGGVWGNSRGGLPRAGSPEWLAVGGGGGGVSCRWESGAVLLIFCWSVSWQKWLSSPFPSSSFSPSGLAPEISLLEVLDKDAKAAQLLLQQQDKGPSPSLETSGHSLTSCFTNQGYFFFHLPDALEIEACQVYFTYDPCSEEPDEGGSGAPEGSLLPPLPPLPAEDHAYCTFPPGEDLLLFSPSLPVGPPSMTLGGAGASEERRLPSQNEGAPRDWAPQPLRLPTPRAPDPVDCQLALEATLGEGGEEGPAPCPGEGAGFPWAGPPRQGQLRAPISCLTLNTDAYLSLQELQNQDPAHSP